MNLFCARPEPVEGGFSSARGYPSTSSGRAQRESEFVFTAEHVEASRRARERHRLGTQIKNFGYPGEEKRSLGLKGFTIIEAVLAMAIAGLIITPIFVLHSALLQRVNRSSGTFNALLLGKHFLYEARQKQEPQVQQFTLEKKDVERGITFQYDLHAVIDKKSSLHSLTGLHKETVIITWSDQGKPRKDTLVTFVYKQPEKKKQ